MEEEVNYIFPIVISICAIVWPIVLWKCTIKKDIPATISDIIFISLPVGGLFDYLYLGDPHPIVYLVIFAFIILLIIASRIHFIKNILDTQYILKEGEAS